METVYDKLAALTRAGRVFLLLFFSQHSWLNWIAFASLFDGVTALFIAMAQVGYQEKKQPEYQTTDSEDDSLEMITALVAEGEIPRR